MKSEAYLDSKEIWLEKIMMEYGDRMIRIAYSYLKDWGTAQETVQEVFITCYNRYEQYYHADNFKALIYRITINRCKDLLRSALIKKVIVGTDFFTLHKTKDPSPENLFIQSDENAFITEMVLSLPVKYREAILLFYYENLSIEEISKMLKTNKNTIKSRLKRARELLRNILEGSDQYEK